MTSPAGITTAGMSVMYTLRPTTRRARASEVSSKLREPFLTVTNLGVRADAYLRAGGWADTATGEDHDLWERLRSTGAALSSSVDSPACAPSAKDRFMRSMAQNRFTAVGRVAAIMSQIF